MKRFGLSFRSGMLLGAGVCAGLLAFAVFMQLRMGLEPCPLCIYQRLAFAALGVIFLLGGLHAPADRAGCWTYALLGMVPALLGAGVAARHVWVQSLPQDVMSSCGPPLSFLAETMGPLEVFRTVLTGTANCGDIDWTFLGLSMPMWCLIWFLALLVWLPINAARASAQGGKA